MLKLRTNAGRTLRVNGAWHPLEYLNTYNHGRISRNNERHNRLECGDTVSRMVAGLAQLSGNTPDPVRPGTIEAANAQTDALRGKGQCWIRTFPDIVLYQGRMYYAQK